jgi:hypothetical protein
MMTVARSVADVLNDHVVFEIECIDRMYLNVFVPQLQYAPGLVGFVHRQLGLPIASTAPLGKISDAFTAGIRRYARDHGVPMVEFVRGQRKDDVMHQHLASFTAEEGVVFIGRAQDRFAAHTVRMRFISSWSRPRVRQRERRRAHVHETPAGIARSTIHRPSPQKHRRNTQRAALLHSQRQQTLLRQKSGDRNRQRMGATLSRPRYSTVKCSFHRKPLTTRR